MQPQSLSTGQELTFEQFVGIVIQSIFWLFLAKLNFKGAYLIRKLHMFGLEKNVPASFLKFQPKLIISVSQTFKK